MLSCGSALQFHLCWSSLRWVCPCCCVTCLGASLQTGSCGLYLNCTCVLLSLHGIHSFIYFLMSRLKKKLEHFAQKSEFCVSLENLGAPAPLASLLGNNGLSPSDAVPFGWDVHLHFTSFHLPYFIHFHFLFYPATICHSAIKKCPTQMV